MPTYRYRCTKCDDELEVWQSITDDPLTRHAGQCRGKLVKVLSPAGIVLKGSGFYKTDSRGKAGGSRSEPKESSTSAAKDSGSGSTSKSSVGDTSTTTTKS